VVLHGISPLIWRRLLVRSESTVAQLHEVAANRFSAGKTHTPGARMRVYRVGGPLFHTDARKLGMGKA